ncbi:hypothetical protein BDA96_03G160800 [Sorghum bicolor]|uniref:Glycine-rich protein n=2 Tax=Sorghum bicolor TaxID=4558 RepID=A0A921UQ37_SORBI|nr:uncharacterized protein LOC8086304 [Sorghum bicolor]EES02886.1 hypothetical protein SORBI_3003G152300 [Sorghum bicolor]KAG0537581.1 hypothetical protein BDA96_03G160800 [Sorghum bicolor]|eukprot:XP_002457766.1 uncharacterized protein LOC8086304 [Sorghum bicolor]
MEKRSSSGRASLVVLAGLLLAASLSSWQCHGARDVPAEPEKKPLRPQNVFGFGGFYPGPSVSWVFPGPNGVTPQVGFGGMPGSSAFPGVGGSGGGVSPFTPGGGGVVGIHGAGGGADAAAKKP